MYGELMKKTIKQLNIQTLLEAGTLLSLAAWLFVYLVSGRYLTYVTPRMLPYLIGAVVVLAGLAGVTLTRVFRPNHRARVAQVFVLTLPLILLILPHGMISVSSSQLSSLSVSTAQPAQQSATPTPAPEATDEADLVDQQPQEDIAGLDRENRTIAVTTENYYQWMERFYNEADEYAGYTVSMTGYVVNGSVFAEDEFALTRLVMTCCVSDLAPIGVICKYDHASDWNADDWVSVVGTLTAGSYEINGTTYTEPQLIVTSIVATQEIPGYVYPY